MEESWLYIQLKHDKILLSQTPFLIYILLLGVDFIYYHPIVFVISLNNIVWYLHYLDQITFGLIVVSHSILIFNENIKSSYWEFILFGWPLSLKSCT